MLKRFVPFAILAMGLLLAASVAWTADGENIFQYAYGPANDDPLSNNNIRGACAGSDLDQDGLYEIIVTDYDNGCQVHVYEVTGDNTLTHVWSSPGSNGTTVRCVRTGDMDNDGVGEIIFGVCDGTWSATYEGGIHVYEWDGITDNGYGAAAASIYKTNPSNPERFRTEGFAIGDVDGDGDNELVTCDNTITSAQDGLFILSVTGDFQGAHTWVEEAAFMRAGAHPFGGSPTNAQIGDMDGDGHKEAIFGVWDFCDLYIVEATGPNTYAYQTNLQLDAGYDGVFLDDFGVADLNNDGADEVYGAIYNHGTLVCVTGGSDVSLITYASNVFILSTSASVYGFDIGDQDHGAGSDGEDLYNATWNATGDVYDFEFSGTDPTNPSDWTQYTMVTDISGSGVPYGVVVPPVDMDGDGRREVVITYGSGVPTDRNWFRVFEWAGEPVAVELTSFTAIGAQEMVELSWRVQSEVDNAGFNIYRDGEKISFVESQGNSDAPRTYTWIDKDVIAGTQYSYRISDVSLDGRETMHDFMATATPKSSGAVPTEYWLAQNYPNPFNADTHIEFRLAQAGNTTLKIYNTTGQLVRTLVDGQLDARMHKVRWDGRNQHNELVSSGIYFYRLASGTFAETKKMSFLR